MKLVNNIEINNSAIGANIKKLISQIYKLLPNREENIDWQTPLTTIVEELAGMCVLLPQYHSTVFALLCKLEGLHTLTSEKDFFLYRRTIFECLNILASLKEEVERCQD